jgi:dephospho-CoA kinase
VKRVLLTGMSGTGKSTLVHQLAARGYKAIDADSDEWSHWVPASSGSEPGDSPVRANEDWVWREDRIYDLLATEDADLLFLSGCAENMRLFLPQFDLIVLLSASPDTIIERLKTRADNSYGKHPDELARVLALQQTVEPLLRKVATHEIDTSAPVEEVSGAILRLVL